jgi:hypothetical protein
MINKRKNVYVLTWLKPVISFVNDASQIYFLERNEELFKHRLIR